MDYEVLTPDHPSYPPRLRQRLGAEAPVLHARGALDHFSRWTMAFLTADAEPGYVVSAVWDVFFPVLEFGMNAVSGWQSVNEGVFLRSALDMPWISLTLFTARGIERETYESFLDYRHRPPQDSFVQRREYERRAAAGELLLISASEPTNERQSKNVIMRRNWLACHMADVVFIGGAERVSMQWSVRKRKLVPKRQKTYALARRLVKTGIPVFTVDHPDNRDLHALGIPGYNPETVAAYLESLGARKGEGPEAPPEPPPEAPPEAVPPAQTAPAVPQPAKRRAVQLELWDEPSRRPSRGRRARPPRRSSTETPS